MPSRADRRQRAAPGFTGYSGCLPSSTRHSLELGIVARIIMGCECFLMRAEWRTSLEF